MVRRRAKAAGLDTAVCNHTFRGTGITAYLDHPDAKLEEAQKMAAHSDPKTTRESTTGETRPFRKTKSSEYGFSDGTAPTTLRARSP